MNQEGGLTNNCGSNTDVVTEKQKISSDFQMLACYTGEDVNPSQLTSGLHRFQLYVFWFIASRIWISPLCIL